ncbi:hypothetical protein RUND412_010865 [Rhizina undulata]
MKASFRKKITDFGLPLEKVSVLTTWELSFQELSSNARHLLHLCAFLSNEDIPDELFHRGKRTLDWIIEDELEKARSLRTASGYTRWYNVGPGNTTHRRPYTATKVRQDTITLVASSISVNQYERSSDHWLFERRISNHLNICHDNISRYFSGSNNPKIFVASTNIASAYKELGYFKRAEELYQVALAGYEKSKSFGTDHPSTLDTMHDMAIVFSKEGQHDKALMWYRWALTGRQKVLGSNHLATLDTVNNMAVVFRKQGLYDDAFEWYQRALAGKLKEKTLGMSIPQPLTPSTIWRLFWTDWESTTRHWNDIRRHCPEERRRLGETIP